jgi:hypothetical protein
MILPLLSAFAFGFGAIASKRSEDGGARAGARADVILASMLLWRLLIQRAAKRFDGIGFFPIRAFACPAGNRSNFFRPACAVSLKNRNTAFILKHYELCRGGSGEKFPAARHRKDDDVKSSLVSMYQSGVRANLPAELHRVSMPALPFAAGGAARPQGAETPQRRELEKTF